jgi:hypothetical protein
MWAVGPSRRLLGRSRGVSAIERFRLSIAIPFEKSRRGQHRFPLRLFAAAIAISVLALAVGTGLSWQMNYRFDEVRARDAQLDDYISHAKLFDEVLTMSARMAAATGDLSYKERYDKYDVDLEALIKTTASAVGTTSHGVLARFPSSRLGTKSRPSIERLWGPHWP